jgi:hypothetical protein
MPVAYLIAGPPSAGNRLVASALVRSGCLGVGAGDVQPKSFGDIPIAGDQPLVIIKHRKIFKWTRALYGAGYSRVVVIVIVREPIANALSLVERGHVVGLEDAQSYRTTVIAQNIASGLFADRLEIITYEGLSELFLSHWLPEIGLPYIPGPLDLPDQDTPSAIQNQNGKHYAACQA